MLWFTDLRPCMLKSLVVLGIIDLDAQALNIAKTVSHANALLPTSRPASDASGQNSFRVQCLRCLSKKIHTNYLGRKVMTSSEKQQMRKGEMNKIRTCFSFVDSFPSFVSYPFTFSSICGEPFLLSLKMVLDVKLLLYCIANLWTYLLPVQVVSLKTCPFSLVPGLGDSFHSFHSFHSSFSKPLSSSNVFAFVIDLWTWSSQQFTTVGFFRL